MIDCITLESNIEQEVKSNRVDTVTFKEYIFLAKEYTNILEFFSNSMDIFQETKKIFKKSIFKDTKTSIHITLTTNEESYSVASRNCVFRLSVYPRYTEYVDDKGRVVKRFQVFYSHDGTVHNQSEFECTSLNVMETIDSYFTIKEKIHRLTNFT